MKAEDVGVLRERECGAGDAEWSWECEWGALEELILLQNAYCLLVMATQLQARKGAREGAQPEVPFISATVSSVVTCQTLVQHSQ